MFFVKLPVSKYRMQFRPSVLLAFSCTSYTVPYKYASVIYNTATQWRLKTKLSTNDQEDNTMTNKNLISLENVYLFLLVNYVINCVPLNFPLTQMPYHSIAQLPKSIKFETDLMSFALKYPEANFSLLDVCRPTILSILSSSTYTCLFLK